MPATTIVAVSREQNSAIGAVVPAAAVVPAPAAVAEAVAVRLDSVSRLFGSFAALRQVTLEFAAGKSYVLLGENGAGKSTLLRILAGLLAPSQGKVRLFGGLAPYAARERVGYMSHAPMLYDELTGIENLDYFRSLYRGRDCLSSEEALRQVGLDPGLTRPVGQYSQGMRQRASLARVLLSQPELLLLDEPFSNMDVESAHQMVRLLDSFCNGERTIVLTTHQRDLSAPIADFILTLKGGRIHSLEPGGAVPRIRHDALIGTEETDV